MEFNDLKTDDKKEVEGVWHEISPTSSVKLARMGNSRYQKYLNELVQPYRHMIRAGSLPGDVVTKLTHKAMAKYCVLDWKGFTENGVECPYTPENAERLLAEARQFRQMVETLASDDEHYRAGEREQDAKNS